MGVHLHNYKEVREYLEKEHPDWPRVLPPRHINSPAEYWPQKVLAVSSVNAAMLKPLAIANISGLAFQLPLALVVFPCLLALFGIDHLRYTNRFSSW